MPSLAGLLNDAFSRPLIGGSVLFWVIASAIVAYWVKRHDDGKDTSNITKTAALAAVSIAVVLSAMTFWQRNIGTRKSEITKSAAVVDPGRGHLALGISDKEWNCASFDSILINHFLKGGELEEVRKQAEGGDGDYLFISAMSYDLGMIDGDHNPEKKQELLRLAVAKGNARAMLGLSSYLYDLGDYVDGEKWLRRARDKGLGMAFLRTAEMYQGEKKSRVAADSSQVISNLQGAINVGCAGPATYRLGLFHYYGKLGEASIPKDVNLGMDFLKRSADIKSEFQADAVDSIVSHYLDNDDLSSASLYIESFEKGCDNGSCASTIGYYYDKSKKYRDAVRWYKKAVEEGIYYEEREAWVKARIAKLSLKV